MSKSKKQLKHKIKMMRADYVELDECYEKLAEKYCIHEDQLQAVRQLLLDLFNVLEPEE